MKTIGEAAQALVERRNRETAALLRTINQDSGPQCYLRKRLSPLCLVVPEKVSAEALASHAPWELRAAALRAATCAHCPSEGGACDGERGYYAEGLRPEWDEGALRPTACERWQGYAYRRRLVEAGVQEQFLDATFDNYAPQNDSQEVGLAKVMEFAHEGSPTKRLTIRGATGVGKTHLAVAALKVLADRGSIMFAYVPALVESVRAELFSGRTDTMDRAVRTDYLVLDDLGAERSTEYVRETLEKLLNARMAMRRAMIITMNVTADQLADNLGPPVARRATIQLDKAVEMHGLPYEA